MLELQECVCVAFTSVCFKMCHTGTRLQRGKKKAHRRIRQKSIFLYSDLRFKQNMNHSVNFDHITQTNKPLKVPL